MVSKIDQWPRVNINRPTHKRLPELQHRYTAVQRGNSLFSQWWWTNWMSIWKQQWILCLLFLLHLIHINKLINTFVKNWQNETLARLCSSGTLSHTARGRVNLWSHLRKPFGIHLPNNSIPRYVPRRNAYVDICAPEDMYILVLFMIVSDWKQPDCPPISEGMNKLWYIHTEYEVPWMSCKGIGL